MASVTGRPSGQPGPELIVAPRTRGSRRFVPPHTTDRVQPPSSACGDSFISDDSFILDWSVKDGCMPSLSCLPSRQPVIIRRMAGHRGGGGGMLHWPGQLSMKDDFPAVCSAGWIMSEKEGDFEAVFFFFLFFWEEEGV